MPQTLAALALLCCALQDKVPAPKADEPAEESVAARKGDLTPLFELEAVYEPVDSAEFRLKLEAFQGDLTLQKAVPAGELVKKGDLLIQLDRAPLDRQIAALEQDLRAARAALEKLSTDLSLGARGDALALLQAQTGVKDAETALKTFELVEGKHMVELADLNVKYMDDAIHDQTEELTQLEKMYKSEELTNATSEIVVRRARRNLERLRVNLGMQKEEAGNVKNVRYPQQRQSLAHSVETAKNSLELLVSAQALGRVQRETEAAKSKAALAVLEEQAAKLAKDAEAFAWRAPLDGRVFYGQFQHGAWATAEQITPLMQPGEKLQAGQVLITVCGPRTRARADLPETDFFDVGAGLEATVSPLAAPDAKASGLVHSKSTVASSKGSFELRIDFKEAPADLFPGMKGKATIQGKPLKDVVLVPSAALAAQGTKCSVSVCKDGKTSPREVVAGKSDGKLTQVKSGLEAGEKVVVPK